MSLEFQFIKTFLKELYRIPGESNSRHPITLTKGKEKAL